jgi:hypothetical protein
MLYCNMSTLTAPVVVYLGNNYDEGEMNFYLVIHTNICLVPVKYKKYIEKVEKKVICSIYVCYMYQGWYKVW